MQVMLMRLMSKGEYVIVSKGTKFRGAGKLGLNVHKFKTKPPFDKWSTPYDRGLKNTAFVVKNDESSAVC